MSIRLYYVRYFRQHKQAYTTILKSISDFFSDRKKEKAEKVSCTESEYGLGANIACVSTLRHFSEKLYLLIQLRATMMIMNGIPLNEISKRLGHNCASTTSNIYCHVIEEADQKAAEALDNAILSKLKRA